MEYVTRKICLVGAAGVGKTSLSTRFLTDTFSERYLSTVGVKVGSREIDLGDRCRAKLIVWDIAGANGVAGFNTNYLKGAAGILYVADGTRRETLDVALGLRQELQGLLGPSPALLLINKLDLAEHWEIAHALLSALEVSGMKVVITSAKDGTGVEQAFLRLAHAVVNP